MYKLKYLLIAGVAGAFLMVSAPGKAAPKPNAQVAVEVGPAPDCPYGYYDYAPYACAPYGYYGPEWFVNGVFIGTGPWYHGHPNFHGHVDTHFDVHHGYHGPLPERGAHPDAAHRPGEVPHFKGNEMHDEHGHVVK